MFRTYNRNRTIIYMTVMSHKIIQLKSLSEFHRKPIKNYPYMLFICYACDAHNNIHIILLFQSVESGQGQCVLTMSVL